MLTLEDYLRRDAELWPEKTAVVCGRKSLTYGELWNAVRNRADEFARQGLTGRPYVFRATQDTDFLVTYFAAHLAGAVAVPLEHEVPEMRFREAVGLVEDADMPLGTADVLFTSGTTGKGKGAMLSHVAILANAENLVEAHGFAHDLTFVVCGPLNHLGSLSKVWPVVWVGATLHLTQGMKDFDAFFAALDGPGCKFATFLVPAALRMLLAFGREELHSRAPRIDFIETGAAPLAQSDMDALCSVLPGVRLYNTYASTETGIVCTHDYNHDGQMAGCLGRPMKHSRVMIAPDGTVACQGRTLMTGYVGNAQLTGSVLKGNTMHTRDKGYIDAEGRLHLAGRTDDTINVGGYKVNPSEVEELALACPGVADCVCVAVPHPVVGQALKLLIVVSEGHTLDARGIARRIRAQAETYKVPQSIEQVDAVRRTYNGKIDRKAYREEEAK